PRHAPTALAVLLALSWHDPAFAADCDAGSVLKLRLRADRVRFDGTVTRRGASHATFLAGGPLQLRIVKAADGATVYAADIPADRFVSSARTTRYAHGGAFQG